MESVSFPLDLYKVVKALKNYKVKSMTYQQMAKLHNCTIEYIECICQSQSGCTQYQKSTDRYLILWNNDENIVSGRKRWTQAHEIGHIVLKHLPLANESAIAENSFGISCPNLESEADIFAAELLAPLPLFDMFNIKSPEDIKHTFGLSNEASNNRWNDYKKWKSLRRKTYWENDMKKNIKH